MTPPAFQNVATELVAMRRGFSLIELLVVISIAVLLIALLLPALSRAREASRMMRNLSQLQQIQVALHTYAADSRSSLPFSRFFNPGPPAASLPYWAGLLAGQGYVSDPLLFWGPFRTTDWFSVEFGSHTHEQMQSSPTYATNYKRADFGANINLMPLQAVPGSRPHRLGHRLPVHSDAFSGSQTAHHPQPHQIVSTAQFYLSGLDGTRFGEYAGPKTTDGLFTVNGRAARAYLDGHAVAGPSEAVSWHATTPAFGTWIGDVNPLVVFRRRPWFSPN